MCTVLLATTRTLPTDFVNKSLPPKLRQCPAEKYDRACFSVCAFALTAQTLAKRVNCMTSRQATGSNAHSCFGPPHSCDACVCQHSRVRGKSSRVHLKKIAKRAENLSHRLANRSSQESLIRAACKVPTLSRHASMAFDCSAGISMRQSDHDQSRPGWLSLGKLSLTENSSQRELFESHHSKQRSASRTP